jgi:hypothetical protein
MVSSLDGGVLGPNGPIRLLRAVLTDPFQSAIDALAIRRYLLNIWIVITEVGFITIHEVHFLIEFPLCLTG